MQVYASILHYGGPLAMKYVSELFMGPSIRTIKRHNAEFSYPLAIQVTPEFLTVVKRLLEKWGLLNAPLLVTEDATALQMRVDIAEEDGAVYVFGLNGCSFRVNSVREFTNTLKERGLASSLHVYAIVPLVAHAPHFPLFAFMHNNSKSFFSADIVRQMWQYMWKVCDD